MANLDIDAKFCIVAHGTLMAKKGPHAEKQASRFADIDRAQTEQQLNLVHDRGFGSSPFNRVRNLVFHSNDFIAFCCFRLFFLLHIVKGHN